MSIEVDGIGDAVMGGLNARAVEPKAGEPGITNNAACLNCETPLVGPYCYQCGQVGHLHRTLAAIWHDLLHGVLHFEGKIWHTLPLLTIKPGALTRRYIHGQRARFISPLALFLFAVFMMFAVMQVRGIHLEAPEETKEVLQEAKTEVVTERDQLKAKLTNLDQKIASDRAAGQDVSKLQAKRAETQQEYDALGTIEVDDQGKVVNVNIISPPLHDVLTKANKNPDLVLYKIQNSAYKFSWLLIPISVPFVWLIFAWRRQYKVYDHAIFVIYSLSFFTLLGTLFTVFQSWGTPTWLLARAFVLIAPVHMFLQLKQAYQLRWWNALLRTLALLFFCVIALTIFLSILVAMGVTG